MSQKADYGDTSHRSGWRVERASNRLPPLPPRVELETKPVLKRCVTARAALGELKQAAVQLPNPAILITMLPLLEAQASAEIEHIVTTAGRQAASRHLKALATIGVLREQAVGREKLFINVRLFQLLTGATNTSASFPRRGAGGAGG